MIQPRPQPQSSRKRRSKRSESGAAIAEAVIAVPLFIFLIFVAIEFMIMSWRALTLQFVATQTMRNIVTGMCADANGNPEYCEVATRRVDFAIAEARRLSRSYGLGSSADIIVCITRSGERATDCPNPEISAGNPGTVGGLVEVITRYPSPLVFKMFGINSVGTTLWGPSGGKSDRFDLIGVAVGRVEGRQIN